MSVCRQPLRLGDGKDGKNQSELKSHEATHERRSTSTGAWRCCLDDTGTQANAPGASHLAVLNMKLGRGVMNCLTGRSATSFQRSVASLGGTDYQKLPSRSCAEACSAQQSRCSFWWSRLYTSAIACLHAVPAFSPSGLTAERCVL